MKRFLATTAMALILATGGSFAAAQVNIYQAQPTDIRASDIIGMRVYATQNQVPTTRVDPNMRGEWDDIGEVNEVILSRDGMVKAVVIGVGGFLGIGEKSVALQMTDVKFVPFGDRVDDVYLVVNATKEMLNDAPAYVPSTGVGPSAQVMPDNNAAMPDVGTTGAITNRTPLTRPEVVREGFSPVAPTELTAAQLTGARVYGTDDKDVGEIKRLVLNDAGQIQMAVIDVGGFLGVGERQIALTLQELNIVRDDAGNVRVYIESNQEALKAQPAYKEPG